MPKGLLILLAILAAQPLWAQINKCVGPDGKVEFTNSPCPSNARGGEVHVRPNTVDMSGLREQSERSDAQRFREQQTGYQSVNRTPPTAAQPGNLSGGHNCRIARKNYETAQVPDTKGRIPDASKERAAVLRECSGEEPAGRTASNGAVDTRVDGEFEGWQGETIVRLQNGQIWQQIEYHYHYHYSFSPRALVYLTGGGYKMKVEGLEKAVRVERLK